MERKTFKAEERTTHGKGAAGRMRSEGKIPAIIYGSGMENVLITLDTKDFLKNIKGVSESTMVTIDLGNKKHNVFVKETQHDLLSNTVMHVDFYEVAKGHTVRTHVPFHFNGIPNGVRAGGILETPMHALEVECDPSVLPEKIEIDLTSLEANHSVHVRDLKLDSKIKIHNSLEQVIALVKFAKAEEAPAAEAVAPVAAAAAPAAPAAAKTDKK